jgi:autotransporter-associated beta strand protein
MSSLPSLRSATSPLFGAALCGLVFAATASAQTTFIKANNTTSLSQAASYVGNTTVPGVADTVQIDNTVTANTSASIGTGLSITGLKVLNPTGTFTISSSGNSTLTLGSGGIDMSGAASNLTINAPVALSANQSWQLTTGRTLILSNNSTLTENGFSANLTGNGTFDYRAGGVVTFSGAMNQTSLFVNYANANLTLTNAANSFTTFNLNNGKVSASSIANFGQASALGTGGTNTTITIGSANASSTLDYTGATTSTNRTFTRDSRSAVSALNVTDANTTLTITGTMGSGSQLNSGSAGWTFGGAGNLVLMGTIANSSNTTSTGTTITKNDAGTLTIGGTHSASGVITVNGGTLQIGAGGTTGTVNSTANITNNSKLAFNRSDTGFTYSGVISGTGVVGQIGSGQAELTGVNTYSGKTSVANGTLAFGNGDASATAAQALGTNADLDLGVAGTSSGVLKYTGTTAATLAKNINAIGNGSDAIENASSSLLTLSGSIVKNGTVLTFRGGTGAINVTGVISGSSANSDLIINGGQTYLNAANTYNGPTIVTNGGNLIAAAAGALPTSTRTAVTLDPTGSTGNSTLTLGASQAVAALSGIASSKVALATTTLTVGASSGSATFAGVISGSGGLTKDGASTQVLSGANTFTGTTRIEAGILSLGANDVLANTSNLVLAGGKLDAGSFTDSVGTLTLETTSVLQFASGGALSFANSSGATWATGATLQLSGSWNPYTSLRFGTDSTGLTSNQLLQIAAPGTNFSDFRLDSGGYLYAAIPEPSTYALLALGGALCLVWHRRRRHA